MNEFWQQNFFQECSGTSHQPYTHGLHSGLVPQSSHKSVTHRVTSMGRASLTCLPWVPLLFPTPAPCAPAGAASSSAFTWGPPRSPWLLRPLDHSVLALPKVTVVIWKVVLHCFYHCFTIISLLCKIKNLGSGLRSLALNAGSHLVLVFVRWLSLADLCLLFLWGGDCSGDYTSQCVWCTESRAQDRVSRGTECASPETSGVWEN